MRRLIFIFFMLSLLVFSNDTEDKNILVIHSYHHGLEWTDSISDGIKSVFQDKVDVKLYFEYLDTKRNFSDKYFEKLKEFYKEKLFSIEFEAIIVSDNAALDFIVDNGEELLPDAPVVFCGVNNFETGMLKGRKNISGIIERADHKKNIDMILTLHKDMKKLIVINDKTLTGKHIQEELNPVLAKYKDKIDIEVISDFTIHELQEKLEKQDSDTVIYLLVVNRDRNGKFISYNEGIRKIREVTNNPIYGAWDFYLGKGIVGGNIISGYKHGEEAGKLVNRIIEGEKIGGEVKDSGSEYIFDYNEILNHSIRLNEIEGDKKFINKREKLIKKYAEEIILFIVILLIILLILHYLDVKNKKELKRLVEIRTRELTEANKELEKISITDSLTGLFRRRYLMRRLEEEMSRCRRNNSSMSIIMFDIDHFKKINDTFGHQAGDMVIRKVAEVFKNNLRINDIIGRYGGEEFLVVLPGEDKRTTEVIAEKIRKGIEETDFGKDIPKITISGGIYQMEYCDIQNAIKKADECLYKAKANGRNRIEK